MTKWIECKVARNVPASTGEPLKPPPAGLPAGGTGRRHGRDMPPRPGRVVIRAEVREMNIR